MSSSFTAPKTSHAYIHRADLPGREGRLDRGDTSAPSFNRASMDQPVPHQVPGRSSMVAKDRPHPAPRPSPALSMGPDRAAFDAAWKEEARQAQDKQREAFKAMRRQEAARGRNHTITRDTHR
jgi:hypothetical protein